MINKNYYAVTCKCGHVRIGNYIPITFGVIAENGREAARIARDIPRVKHHQKDCIISCRRISKEEFDEILQKNDEDPYLLCHSRQEQKQYDLSDRIVAIKHEDKKHHKTEKTKNVVCLGKNIIRKPKSYIRNYIDDLEFDYNYNLGFAY